MACYDENCGGGRPDPGACFGNVKTLLNCLL